MIVDSDVMYNGLVFCVAIRYADDLDLVSPTIFVGESGVK